MKSCLPLSHARNLWHHVLLLVCFFQLGSCKLGLLRLTGLSTLAGQPARPNARLAGEKRLDGDIWIDGATDGQMDG